MPDTNKADIEILARCPLFEGIEKTRIPVLLERLRAVRRVYPAGSIIILEGDTVECMFILLSGSASGFRVNEDGGVFTVADLTPGDLFADILCSAPVGSPITVEAVTDCEAYSVPVASLLSGSCELGGILKNLLNESGKKYFELQARITLLMERQLRKKLLLYLRPLCAGSGEVTLKMNRAQLADYLGCERSALCRELSRMRADGIISLDGRRIRLL